ncbi:MAG: PTS fructose transporter subunit IIA [Bacilli bacterium]|nr:PTS fructose transporter subunit IIA [Bacilli bacterium]MDD4643975.1 PTS fructose transporter subunit IIA [Bacilli bacterium]
MKNIIVITGHAQYASGLLSSLEMIAGKNEDFIAVDFDDNSVISELYTSVTSRHQKDNILFICDLLGGTPFKEASKIAFDNPNMEVVTGCNLGSLLEIYSIKDDLSLSELISRIITSSQKHTMHLNKSKLVNKSENKDEDI